MCNFGAPSVTSAETIRLITFSWFKIFISLILLFLSKSGMTASNARDTSPSWWKCHWTNLIHIILDRSFAYADTSSTNHQDNQASDLNPPQPQSRTAPGRLEAGDNEEDEEHQNLKKVMFRRLRVLLPLSMTKLFFPLKELKLDIFIKSFMWDTLNVNTLFPSTTRRVFIKL